MRRFVLREEDNEDSLIIKESWNIKKAFEEHPKIAGMFTDIDEFSRAYIRVFRVCRAEAIKKGLSKVRVDGTIVAIGQQKTGREKKDVVGKIDEKNLSRVYFAGFFKNQIVSEVFCDGRGNICGHFVDGDTGSQIDCVFREMKEDSKLNEFAAKYENGDTAESMVRYYTDSLDEKVYRGASKVLNDSIDPDVVCKRLSKILQNEKKG